MKSGKSAKLLKITRLKRRLAQARAARHQQQKNMIERQITQLQSLKTELFEQNRKGGDKGNFASGVAARMELIDRLGKAQAQSHSQVQMVQGQVDAANQAYNKYNKQSERLAEKRQQEIQEREQQEALKRAQLTRRRTPGTKKCCFVL